MNKILLFFLFTFYISTFAQKDKQEGYANKINLSLSSGLLVGDSRFYPMFNTAFSFGYYLTDNATFSLNYSPIHLRSNNNQEPFFYVDGDTLRKNESVVLNELHLIYSNKIIKNIWISFGVAPIDRFSYLLGIEYKTNISKKVDVVFRNQFLTIGRYFFDDIQNSFATYRFSIGIEFRP